MIICSGVLPYIVLDLLLWKTQCLFTYIRSGFVNHYYPVESQKLYLSRPGFVNVQNCKNSVRKLNITIMFPFDKLSKVHYNTCQGYVRFANWSKEKTKYKNCLQWIKVVKKKPTTHTVKICYIWMFCIPLKGRNTKRFVQNWHSPSHLRQNGHDFV